MCIDELLLVLSVRGVSAELTVVREAAVVGIDEMLPESVVSVPVDDSRVLCADPGGGGAGLNKLPMPLTTSPGCMPKNGVSKLMVPRTRCLN